MQCTTWQFPLELAATLAQEEQEFCLLYSGTKTGYSGRYSYLAWDVEDIIETEQGRDAFTLLESCTVQDNKSISTLPHWFGYIGYEALHASVANIPATRPTLVPMPALRFIRYRNVMRFDHDNRTIETEGAAISYQRAMALTKLSSSVAIAESMDLMPRQHYLNHAEDALEQIRAGEFYQVNLTRKMGGFWQSGLTPAPAFGLFIRLCHISPAPYSAFLHHGGCYILSSSPELFVSVDNMGRITTRPIKGTAPRHTDPVSLLGSLKDRAENLMITDLMRNDLARCAIAGSVTVPELFDIDSFATLHHLSSTVTAIRKKEVNLTDIVRALFPAGSMTGAPKLAAMRWIANHEQIDRGVYSGALGWIHGQQCELSVVIRTLIASHTRFEYQIGGGIVADSDPAGEYHETCIKARGIESLL